MLTVREILRNRHPDYYYIVETVSGRPRRSPSETVVQLAKEDRLSPRQPGFRRILLARRNGKKLHGAVHVVRLNCTVAVGYSKCSRCTFRGRIFFFQDVLRSCRDHGFAVHLLMYSLLCGLQMTLRVSQG